MVRLTLRMPLQGLSHGGVRQADDHREGFTVTVVHTSTSMGWATIPWKAKQWTYLASISYFLLRSTRLDGRDLSITASLCRPEATFSCSSNASSLK